MMYLKNPSFTLKNILNGRILCNNLLKDSMDDANVMTRPIRIILDVIKCINVFKILSCNAYSNDAFKSVLFINNSNDSFCGSIDASPNE